MSVQPDGHPKRRHGRIRCQDVECNLGIILDVSASGMRVRGRKSLAVNKPLLIQLATSELCVEIEAVVRWCARAGIFAHEAGLEFVDVHEDARKILCELARTAASNDTIARDVRKWRETDDRKAS